MNKIGIHALVWAGSWGARECEYTVASSKEAGYDLVEFPVFQPAAMDVEAIQRALSANGMTATCSLGLSFDKDINSEDPACVARGEAAPPRRPDDRSRPGLAVPRWRHLQRPGPIHGDAHGAQPPELGRRHPAPRGEGGTAGHHARPRVRQPLRVEPAQHDGADARLHRGGRDAQRRRACRLVPHEHRGDRLPVAHPGRR